MRALDMRRKERRETLVSCSVVVRRLGVPAYESCRAEVRLDLLAPECLVMKAKGGCALQKSRYVQRYFPNILYSVDEYEEKVARTVILYSPFAGLM